MSRFRLTLALCLVVSGAFAVNAVAAQAAPHWNVNGGALAEGTVKAVETTASSGYTLKTEILGHPNEEIHCNGQTSNGAFIKGTKFDGATSLEFFGCSMPTAPACEIPNITTGKVSTELIEVPATGTGTLYDKFVPATGETRFATVFIEGGCALEGEYVVTGSAAGEDTAATTEMEKHTLNFSQAIATAAGTQLQFEGKPAIFTGNSTLRLTSHENWSAQH